MIHLAAKTGTLDDIQYLQSKGLPMCEPNSDKQTALQIATLAENTEIAQFLQEIYELTAT